MVLQSFWFPPYVKPLSYAVAGKISTTRLRPHAISKGRTLYVLRLSRSIGFCHTCWTKRAWLLNELAWKRLDTSCTVWEGLHENCPALVDMFRSQEYADCDWG